MKSNSTNITGIRKPSAAEITHALKAQGHDMVDVLKNIKRDVFKNGIETGRKLERQKIKNNLIEGSTLLMESVVLGLTLAEVANYFMNKRGDKHECL